MTIEAPKTEARWHVEAWGTEVVAIVDDFDPAEPSRTVTNDAEAVVDERFFFHLNPLHQRLIYRDTEGIWDEIIVSKTYPWRFLGFAPIRARNICDALIAIQGA